MAAAAPTFKEMPPAAPGLPSVSRNVRLLPDGYALPTALELFKEDAAAALGYDVDEVWYDDVVLRRRYRVRARGTARHERGQAG